MNSFFKKLTGADFINQDEEQLENDLNFELENIDEDQVFDLPIDVYQDNENIYVKSFIPGVEPSDIDILITRDTVEIIGERVEHDKMETESYHQRELIWGKFSKKVLLPHEVDVDKVRASTKNGMIILKMPKLDKFRSVRVSLN